MMRFFKIVSAIAFGVWAFYETVHPLFSLFAGFGFWPAMTWWWRNMRSMVLELFGRLPK